MAKLIVGAIAALTVAAALTATASREPFMPRLVRLEAAAALPELAQVLDGESVALNAVLLEYAHDTTLRLNAHLALLRHPGLAREILPIFGSEQEFREVLAAYGPAVLPPIAYFMRHEVRSLQVMRVAGEALAGAKGLALRLLGGTGDTGDAVDAAPQGRSHIAGGLSPVERGWYAVAFIREEGHDFLGQFVVDADGGVEWLQTERIAEGVTGFFTSGVRALETRYLLDEDPSASDFLWAGVDVALAAGAVKLLRLGRAAGTGTRSAASARASLAARSVVRAGRVALRVGKLAVPLAVAWAVVRHPSLISGIGAWVADLAGWPVAPVQALVWFLVLLPLLLAASAVTRWLVRPLRLALRAASRALRWLERQSGSRRDGRRAPGGGHARDSR